MFELAWAWSNVLLGRKQTAAFLSALRATKCMADMGFQNEIVGTLHRDQHSKIGNRVSQFPIWIT